MTREGGATWGAASKIKMEPTDFQLTPFAVSGEGGSRTYRIIENYKISIHCKLSVYKIVNFIETHKAYFDI